MSEFKSSSFRNEDNSGAPDIIGVTSFTSPFYFVPPSGTTAQRPSGDGLAPGMLRFNTDIGRLEVWRGDHWATILGESPNLNGGARGLFGGGYTASPVFGTPSIDYITISTLGNAISFGTLFTGRYGLGSCASSTRAVWMGGQSSPGNLTNLIDFVTISSTGNAADFADLNASNRHNVQASASSSTRGLVMGGFNSSAGVVNIIDYITIASQGTNAQDFGDLSTVKQAAAASSSSTRAVCFGGGTPTRQSTIDYVTISTQGNSQNFGSLGAITWFSAGCSNSTRGLNAGNNPATNVIEFITFASTGNAQDFGDLIGNRQNVAACSSPIRGIFGAGSTPPSTNSIEYVTIASTGNAQDFGDLANQNANGAAACSNAHGGL